MGFGDEVLHMRADGCRVREVAGQGGRRGAEQLLRGEKGINVRQGWWVKGRGPSEGH